MKKKLIVAAATILLIAICAVCFVACNPYKWKGIGGGDPDATAESNGGYVVKQGNYLYFINGYAGYDGDNTFGTPQKNAIVRAELDADGAVKNDTAKVVVPKLVHNSADGGFAIFKDWIYYATYNSDKDKNGTASTTKMDFMRTKIDGSATQRIAQINSRTMPYFFTENRILYFDSDQSVINYIDFSGMPKSKSVDNGKGAVAGVLAEHVSTVVWDYAVDKAFYVKTLDGTTDSYKNYNEIHSITFDGKTDKVLATENTFVANDTDPNADSLHVYKYSLVDIYPEQDDVTLYYSKTYMYGSSSSSTQDAGTFCAKASDIKNTEKMLKTTALTSLYPLGYEEGAFSGSSWYDGNSETPIPVEVTGSSTTIHYVDQKNGIIYYSASSSASELDKISYKGEGNADIVIAESMKIDELKLEFIGDRLYFFATSDDNWMHTINFLTFEKTDADGEKIESAYIGVGRPEEEEDK